LHTLLLVVLNLPNLKSVRNLIGKTGSRSWEVSGMIQDCVQWRAALLAVMEIRTAFLEG
jgi:hypothetical protein